MVESPVRWSLEAADPGTHARCGVLSTLRGEVRTPCFMPVGTQGTVKGLAAPWVRQTGAEMILANTYHLVLRPGAELVAQLGGLHRFMGWQGPILTDSGGFQVFSLSQRMQLDESGVTFRSHVDGSTVRLTPERAIRVQELLGSDIAMVLDHVVPLPESAQVVQEAMQRSIRWAARCREAQRRHDQALFGIVQGGLDVELRRRCLKQLLQIGFDGYAIGGLSVGEPPPEMYRVLRATVPEMPEDKPRYLMGVGRPEDLLEAIACGVDMFDCVMPTRNGRNAMAFTARGPIRIRNRRYREDTRPLEEDCPCLACRHSRAYLRHLFLSREMLGPVLLSIHNLTYYQRLLAGAREAIARGEFAAWRAEQHRGWAAKSEC